MGPGSEAGTTGARGETVRHIGCTTHPKGDQKGSFMFVLSDPRRTQVVRMVLWTVLALLVISLFSPSVSRGQFYRVEDICKAPHWSLGWEFLLTGPLGAFFEQYGWFANPLMLFAVLTRARHPALALIAALVAVALIVVTAYSYTSEWRDGDVPVTVCGFGPGYYLWLACSVLVLIATLLKPARR